MLSLTRSHKLVNEDKPMLKAAIDALEGMVDDMSTDDRLLCFNACFHALDAAIARGESGVEMYENEGAKRYVLK